MPNHRSRAHSGEQIIHPNQARRGRLGRLIEPTNGLATGSNGAAGGDKRGARWRGRRQLFKPLLAPPASEVGLNMALQLAPQCTRPTQGSGGRFLCCHRPAQFGPWWQGATRPLQRPTPPSPRPRGANFLCGRVGGVHWAGRSRRMRSGGSESLGAGSEADPVVVVGS